MTAGHATLANIKILSCVCTKPKNYVSKGAIGGGGWGRSRVETRIEFISRKCCEKIFVCVITFVQLSARIVELVEKEPYTYLPEYP